MTAGPGLRSHEQHEEAAQNDVGRHEDVQSLQDLLHDQELKVHSVVEELAEAAQLLPLSLRYDHHKSYHRSGDSEDRGDDAESTHIGVQSAQTGHRIHKYHSFLYVCDLYLHSFAGFRQNYESIVSRKGKLVNIRPKWTEAGRIST